MYTLCKKIIIAIMLFILLLQLPSNALAADNITSPIHSLPRNISTEVSISPYLDNIVTKTRLYHGKFQYRRWNSTKHCWVDSHWIDF